MDDVESVVNIRVLLVMIFSPILCAASWQGV